MGTYLNPYAFLPLPEAPCPRAPMQRGTLTGEIVCTLTPVSALFIPDPEDPAAFCTDAAGLPRIPGSSLRGMLRRLYEALTDSCLPAVESVPVPVRSLGSKQPGLLRRQADGWTLYAAHCYAAPALTAPAGQAVWFHWIRDGRQFLADAYAAGRTDTCKTQGIAGDGCILVRRKDIPAVRVPDALAAGFPESGMHPVWFGREGGVLRISDSRTGSERSLHAPSDYAGDYAPCHDRERLCPACRLFGAAPEAGEALTASRIRVTDGRFLGDAPEYAPRCTISLPGRARVTSMEVYTRLHDGEHAAWSYDARRDADGIHPLSPADLTLAGRRFYLHIPGCEEAPLPCRGIREIPAHPLCAGEQNAFGFSVYFEDLTEHELKMLLRTASLLGNASPYCTKLGAGRPAGLGSVKTQVNCVRVRTVHAALPGMWDFSESPAYCKYCTGSLPEEDMPCKLLRDLLDPGYVPAMQAKGMLTDDPPVHYPPGYDWFGDMRRTGKLRPFDASPIGGA